MLDVISEYKFCSAACHEAIEILDILKVSFDDEDIETLKGYVSANLSSPQRTLYSYQSKRTTTNPNLATIIKIGIALKRLTAGGVTIPLSHDEDDFDSHSNDGEEFRPHSSPVAAAAP